MREKKIEAFFSKIIVIEIRESWVRKNLRKSKTLINKEVASEQEFAANNFRICNGQCNLSNVQN